MYRVWYLVITSQIVVGYTYNSILQAGGTRPSGIAATRRRNVGVLVWKHQYQGKR